MGTGVDTPRAAYFRYARLASFDAHSPEDGWRESQGTAAARLARLRVSLLSQGLPDAFDARLEIPVGPVPNRPVAGFLQHGEGPLRVRLPERVGAWGAAVGVEADEAWVERARDGVISTLESAGVVGTMPNIAANRINGQLDLGGPSFTVSAEELSGIRALEIATRALRAEELDVAIKEEL